MMHFFRKKSVQGFTLVELLVSMAIFVTVITIAVGALFSAQVVNTKLEQTQAVLDGMHLATEVIVREMRYGAWFYCDTSIPSPLPSTRKSCDYPNGGTVLIFKPTAALLGTTDETRDRVAYYLSSGVLYKNEYPYGGTMRVNQITSSDVRVDTLSFYATGLNTTAGTSDYLNVADYNQPLITMIISGETVPRKITSQPVSFSVQTSAASRTLDR